MSLFAACTLNTLSKYIEEPVSPKVKHFISLIIIVLGLGVYLKCSYELTYAVNCKCCHVYQLCNVDNLNN